MIEGIKSEYILRKVFKYIPEGIYLRILNHNKKLQNKLNIVLNDFKRYSEQIVIEIIPAKKIPYKSTFINKYTHNLHIIYISMEEQKKEIIF